jgi:serine protease AprX
VVDSGVRACNDLSEIGAPACGSSRTPTSLPPTISSTTPAGHGTHVAGIIAGNGAASTGSVYYRTFYGIARRANIINIRVLDGKGQGTVSGVAAGIQWAVDNRRTHNIRVMNLSLGHRVGESYKTDPLCLAVEKAWKAGIVVVCSAGNMGRSQDVKSSSLNNEGYGTAYGSIQSPGNSPFVITVGAMKSMGGGRTWDRAATYTSRGPTRLDLIAKPDLVAPGNKVISTLANNSFLDNSYGTTNQIKWNEYATGTSTGSSAKYFRLSGTSMAARWSPEPPPCCCKSTRPDARHGQGPTDATADKWALPDGSSDLCTFGAGYLNIPAALKSTAVATTYATSPALSRDSSGNVYLDAQRALWGSAGSIWGTGVTDNRALWGAAPCGVRATTCSPTAGPCGHQRVERPGALGHQRRHADLSSKAVYGED